ncbi:MAG: DMT family transporter, partial [Promethearchaeota archaeon]
MLLVYLALTFMVLVWSFSFVVVDLAVEFVPPLSIAFYRFIIASLSFLIVDIYYKLTKRRELHQNESDLNQNKFTKNGWLLIIIASFTGVSFFFLAQYTAIEIIGPSLPALFVCLITPVIITILALFVFQENVSKLKIIGFIIATIGGFLLITGGNINTLSPNSPNFLGYLFALLTPLLWAIYSTLTKKISKHSSSFVMNKYIAYFGTLELFVFVLINREITIFFENFLNISLLISALYLGLGCYVLGYYIWQNSQKKLKSSKVASFLYIEPFLTLLFSILLHRSEIIVF